MRVCVVGLGRMGAAMARRIAAEGDHELVVFNRSEAAARAVASDTGATIAESAAQAVESADVCVVSLADDAAVLETYRGEHGLLAGLRRGAVVCDTSTLDPATVTALAPEVADRGAQLLDTPVSGSVSLVESGGLTIMVGGDAQALETARPLLDLMAKAVFPLGPTGSGSTMKLVVNSLVMAVNAGISESIVLAERAGIDRQAAYDVLAASAASSPFLTYKRQSFLDPDNTAVAFSLDLVAKDQALIHALAAAVGARMDQADAGRELVTAALVAGLGDRDLSALAEFLRG